LTAEAGISHEIALHIVKNTLQMCTGTSYWVSHLLSSLRSRSGTFVLLQYLKAMDET
jgi:hypothetical protein